MDRNDKISGKKVLKLRNLSETRAELAIYGVIGESFWDDSISALDVHNVLAEMPSTVNQLDVRLNSPGGDVFDGNTIYNRLRQFKGNVTVYVDGLAASIASVIMLAGNEIKMGEGSLVMIHKPWTFAVGNANEFQNTIGLLDDIEDTIVGVYKRRTKLESNQLRKMMAETTWFDADQAIQNGFATEIIESDEEVEVAAHLMSAKAFIKKMPENPRKAQVALRSQVDEVMKKVKNVQARQ